MKQRKRKRNHATKKFVPSTPANRAMEKLAEALDNLLSLTRANSDKPVLVELAKLALYAELIHKILT